MFTMKKNYFLFMILISLLIRTSTSNAQSLDQIDTQVEQSQGVYQPMKLDYMGYSLGMTQRAWLDPLSNMGEGQTKPAYSRYVWSNGTILPIRIRQSMITLINFPEWEYIQDAWVGDSGSFAAQQIAHNKMLIMPAPGMPAGVDTNIVLIGRSGNRYVFYVRSEGINTERLTHLVVDIEISDNDNPMIGPQKVAGTGPHSVLFGGSGNSGSGGQSSSSKNKSALSDNWWDEVPIDPEKLKFDIEVYVINPEDVDMAPERVWRDDIFTYIDLGPKALNMLQRPVVNLIVQKSEVPVGFRTRGQYGRLIVVEAVGDMVLRNGSKIICLKLRKDPSFGLDMVEYDNRAITAWDVPAPELSPLHQMMQVQSGTPFPTRPVDHYELVTSEGIISPKQTGSYDLATNSSSDPSFLMAKSYNEDRQKRANIAVELGSDNNVTNLEKLWEKVYSQNPDVLNGYEAFFSVDAPADGSIKETFYLRVGPIKTLNEGDILCENLARKGVSCNVVRTR